MLLTVSWFVPTCQEHESANYDYQNIQRNPDKWWFIARET